LIPAKIELKRRRAGNFDLSQKSELKKLLIQLARHAFANFKMGRIKYSLSHLAAFIFANICP